VIDAAGSLVLRLSVHVTDDVSYNDDRIRDDVDPTSSEPRKTDIG
jgi:hypothetical protein